MPCDVSDHVLIIRLVHLPQVVGYLIRVGRVHSSFLELALEILLLGNHVRRGRPQSVEVFVRLLELFQLLFLVVYLGLHLIDPLFYDLLPTQVHHLLLLSLLLIDSLKSFNFLIGQLLL